MRRLVEHLEASVNPLMVKEAHQSFRNRSTVAGGFLALAGPVLIFAIAIPTGAMEGMSDRAGRGLFTALTSCSMLVMWLLVPMRAAAQLHSEIKTKTMELTLLTGLSPWELASGRLQASALQVTLLLAFIAPFAVASTTLGGVGADVVLAALALLFAIGLLQCSGALLAVTTSLLSPRLAAPIALVFVGQMMLTGSMGAAFVIAATERSTGPTWLWILSLVLAASVLFLRLSADVLTPAPSRSYAIAKLLLAGLIALFLGPIAIEDAFVRPVGHGDRSAALSAALILASSFGFVFCAADRRRSRLARVGVLLPDGLEGSVLYTLFLQTAIGIVALLLGWSSAWIALGFVVYFLFFVGTTALLQSLLFTRNFEGFLVGFLLWVVVDLIGMFVMLSAHEWSISNPPGYAALFPNVWLQDADRVRDPWFALPLSVGVGALAVAVLRARRARHG